ncbi:MAG: tetratricopeptide repeat protein [Magnetococcales bacterium]|nr:tetratricopeptide repeat protein [Magnetococcales bacterium]
MHTIEQTSASLLAEAKACHHQGHLDKAWALYEKLLAVDPDNPELLHLTSLVCIRQGAFAQAAERIQRAQRSVPDNPILSYNLGLAWMHQGYLEGALTAFQEAIRLRPDYVNALCQLGRLLIRQRNMGRALSELGKAVRLEPERAEIHALLATALDALGLRAAANYRRRLAWHYGNEGPDRESLPPQHTFFVNQERALHTAQKGHLIQESIQTQGLQICYTLGAPLPDSPPNLVHVPEDPQQAVHFFCFSSLSLPVEIDFDPAVESERLAGSRVAAFLNRVRQARIDETRRLAQICRTTPPVFFPGQPLRVYLPASRHGDVLMHNARDLAQGFRKNGCETLYFVEPDPMHTFDFSHWLRAQADFNPHIVLDINNAFNLASDLSFQSHPDLFRVLWFEDPTPAILGGQPLPWRKRDLIYSISREFDGLLRRCGAPQVHRQGFCYDEEIFQDFGKPRKRQIVLIASSHDFIFHHFAGIEPILAEMEAMFEAGEAMTEEALERFARGAACSRDETLNFLWGYVVRNGSARWLCTLSDEIEVAVYGHRWASNSVVQPFYRGVVPHGPAVARIYNEARYALVPHPFDLQSQRLAEVSACGAIPVVYDCRYRAEQPHWDAHCLWYRTREELRACLTQHPPQSPHRICQGKSYTAFARRILQEVESRLSENR